MNAIRRTFGIVALAALVLASAAAQEQRVSSPAQAALEKMKTLAGRWEGVRNDNQPVRVTYALVAAGNVVQETLEEQGEPLMVSMYHLDGERLVMTHYCSSGNQPRMVAGPLREGQALVFITKEVSNLASPAAGHMGSLIINFAGGDNITHQWTWQEGGKPHHSTQFFLKRVR